ncbi:MAG: SusD/RagB family nutrient-binding outer membrane lipoprotein, partial [Cyclobacteriaceae bacterium]
KIKYLMRISNREDVGAELRAVFQSGRYIKSNSENATFDFSDTQPNTFRMAILRSGDFNLYVMSETMETILNELNDPRISLFFRETANKSGEYNGLLNGQDASATSISVADYSLPGTIFRENTGTLDANFMTAWETGFLLAEAAERKLIDADARELYNEAVKNSFSYWQTAIPAEYLDTGKAAYNSEGEDPLEQIITQKWLSGMINGYEGWIEYRRTGFPVLKNISASLNNGLIPLRMPYPAEEAALNAESYREATADNNNSINAAVWWDQ